MFFDVEDILIYYLNFLYSTKERNNLTVNILHLTCRQLGIKTLQKVFKDRVNFIFSELTPVASKFVRVKQNTN